MKRKLLYAIAIIGIFIVVQIFTTNSGKSEEKIVSAFGEVDFVNKGSSLEAEVDYGNTYLSEEEKKSLIEDLADKIGLNDQYDYNVQKSESEEVISISKEAKNASTGIKFVSIKNEVEENVIELEQYIITTITFNNSVDNVISYKNHLEEIFLTMDLQADITINLSGEYNGKLSSEMKDEIADNLLKKIKAKTITKNKEEDAYNIYAYTSLIEDFIKIDNNKVNVNLAIKYDETKNMTDILLSSPIINTDY